MGPDAVPPDVASFSAGMTLTIGCKVQDNLVVVLLAARSVPVPERPTGRAPRLRAGHGLRSLWPRAQKVVETKVQTCDGAAHKSLRLESFAKLGRIFSK